MSRLQEDKTSIDWPRVIVHFVVGAAIGAGLGFLYSVTGRGDISPFPIIATAMVIGSMGAIFGDRFWRWFFEIFPWLLWW